MKLHHTATALSLALAAFGVATPANAAALVGETYSNIYSFPAGQESLTGQVITPVTPAGKVFVIQTVSILRNSGLGILQSFISLNALGNDSKASFAMPDINTNGDFFPSATMDMTLYVSTGTQAMINLYRSNGGQAETDVISVSGYLNAN